MSVRPSSRNNSKVAELSLANCEILKFFELTLYVLTFIRGVSKQFGEWYQKTNTTGDTNKLTLLAFKIIVILHNTLLATFIKFLETVSKGLFRNRSQNCCHTFLDYRHVCKTCACGCNIRGVRWTSFCARSGEYGGWNSFCLPA
jgi:hypothetical protein